MSDRYWMNVVEAALLAAGRSLKLEELAALFEEPRRPSREELRARLQALQCDYAERGIELKETASGWRIQVRPQLAAEISRLWPERPARYSRALLETLALIAYRQPITRGEIEAVRGVAVNPNIVKTLLERNWIRVVGLRDVPGRPEILGTTAEFLDYFGLKRLDELPALAELKAMTDLNVQLELADPEAPAQPLAPQDDPAAQDAVARDDAPSAAAAEPDVDADEDEPEAAEEGGDPESSAGLVAAPSTRDPAPA